MDLKRVADETKEVLPKILSSIPSFDATKSFLVPLSDLTPLDSSQCPGYTLPIDDEFAGEKGTRIRVFDMDTFECALEVGAYTIEEHLKWYTHSPNTNAAPVAVLNLASERSPGGGWSNGALAQEECLCYRSSLSLSLHKKDYPFPSLSAIYSPSVVIIRDSMASGHNLLLPDIFDETIDLPAVSVISVAALRRPTLTEDKKGFNNEGQRAETKRKIRLTLRIAAHKGHRSLVLGALGCGVFANPPKEVANCFLEVLREKEFSGGWWEDVRFAVLDNAKGEDGGTNGKGNFGVFWRVLDGQVV